MEAPMFNDEHTGHTTCAIPGCPAFHLFCPDCGGRQHTADHGVDPIGLDPIGVGPISLDGRAGESAPAQRPELAPVVARNSWAAPLAAVSATSVAAATNIA